MNPRSIPPHPENSDTTLYLVDLRTGFEVVATPLPLSFMTVVSNIRCVS